MRRLRSRTLQEPEIERREHQDNSDRARCERAQLQRREKTRPVITCTRRRVRHQGARPVDHPVPGTRSILTSRQDDEPTKPPTREAQLSGARAWRNCAWVADANRRASASSYVVTRIWRTCLPAVVISEAVSLRFLGSRWPSGSSSQRNDARVDAPRTRRRVTSSAPTLSPLKNWVKGISCTPRTRTKWPSCCRLLNDPRSPKTRFHRSLTSTASGSMRSNRIALAVARITSGRCASPLRGGEPGTSPATHGPLVPRWSSGSRARRVWREPRPTSQRDCRLPRELDSARARRWGLWHLDRDHALAAFGADRLM